MVKINIKDSLQAQSAVEVKSFGVIQKAELKSQIIIAFFAVKNQVTKHNMFITLSQLCH